MLFCRSINEVNPLGLNCWHSSYAPSMGTKVEFIMLKCDRFKQKLVSSLFQFNAPRIHMGGKIAMTSKLSNLWPFYGHQHLLNHWN